MKVTEDVEVTYSCSVCGCLIPVAENNDTETVVICNCGNVIGVV